MTNDSGSENKRLRERPLSPHLSIYRWQISNTLSIIHRLTGVISLVGSIIIACLFISIALGPDIYNNMLYVIKTPIILIAVFIWTAAMYYHLLNGIRHLFWDIGMGFGLKITTISGVAILIGTAILTAITFWLLIENIGVING